jgi:aerobic-type carbon monoxide dehydrogenase small subunit (CoxS/CutS family)
MFKGKVTSNNKGISRRDFLRDAGVIVGSTTLGSIALLNACGNTTTVTAPGGTITKTITSTVSGGTGVVTTTVTQPGPTITVTGPPGTGGATVTSFTANGNQVALANLKTNWSLAWVLREKLGLVGTKTGCNRGECGTCTIIMDGKSVYSCMVLAVEAEGAQIQTIEGLSNAINLNPLQQSVFDNDSLQCGFCAPGFLMSGQALLNKKSDPTEDEIREALSGHICTCGNTRFYVEAVMKA